MPTITHNADISSLLRDVPRSGPVGYRKLKPLLTQFAAALKLNVSVDNADIQQIEGGFHIGASTAATVSIEPVISSIDSSPTGPDFTLDDDVTWTVTWTGDTPAYFVWMFNGLFYFGEDETFERTLSLGNLEWVDGDLVGHYTVGVIIGNAAGIDAIASAGTVPTT